MLYLRHRIPHRPQLSWPFCWFRSVHEVNLNCRGACGDRVQVRLFFFLLVRRPATSSSLAVLTFIDEYPTYQGTTLRYTAFCTFLIAHLKFRRAAEVNITSAFAIPQFDPCSTGENTRKTGTRSRATFERQTPQNAPHGRTRAALTPPSVGTRSVWRRGRRVARG